MIEPTKQSEALRQAAYFHHHGFFQSDADVSAELRRMHALNVELVEALESLVGIIDKAGLLNLSNGVQLRQTVLYIKATDRLDYARVALAKATS